MTSKTNGISNNVQPSSSKSKSDPIIWDRTHLLKLVGNEDLCEALIGNLNSDRSDDSIQELLFDLLGFERLDLITLLLKNRGSIIKELNRQESISVAIRNQVKSGNSTNAHPVIGVKVQSAEEKMLEKLYRKEDRKAAKNNGVQSSAFATELKEEELRAAQNMSRKIQTGVQSAHTVSSTGIGVELSGGVYPNVFDMYDGAKKTAGFISGVKMVLPDSAVKSQNSEYEEYAIPATKMKPPPEIESRPLIKITSLDETAQKVFRGMTNLNRIQSIVYDTAYKTNENLLICAPSELNIFYKNKSSILT